MGTKSPNEADFFYNYRIRYSSDGQTWTTYGDEISQTENFKVTDFVFENVNARYVIVEATDSRDYWVKISDFMVKTSEIVEEKVDFSELQARVDENETQYFHLLIFVNKIKNIKNDK